MDPRLNRLAQRALGKAFEELDEQEQNVLSSVAKHVPIARDLSDDADDPLGARIADKVAAFGGSWSFIGMFFVALIAWVGVNGWLLRNPPDPFPFIFLNLVLSMVAAFQAPIIMMSQNRQSVKDREAAAHDYEVNLKSEIEIMRLHEKLDELRMVAIEERFTELNQRLDTLSEEIARLHPETPQKI